MPTPWRVAASVRRRRIITPIASTTTACGPPARRSPTRILIAVPVAHFLRFLASLLCNDASYFTTIKIFSIHFFHCYPCIIVRVVFHESKSTWLPVVNYSTMGEREGGKVASLGRTLGARAPRPHSIYYWTLQSRLVGEGIDLLSLVLLVPSTNPLLLYSQHHAFSKPSSCIFSTDLDFLRPPLLLNNNN